MNILTAQSYRPCYSPEQGEGLVLRPLFWGQHDRSESEKPFNSGEQV